MVNTARPHVQITVLIKYTTDYKVQLIIWCMLFYKCGIFVFFSLFFHILISRLKPILNSAYFWATFIF